MKIVGQNANDGVRSSVEDDLLVQGFFLAARCALPKSVSDDRNTIASTLLLCFVEVSAASGRDFQEWEEVGGDAHSRQSFHLIVLRQVEGVGFVAGNVFVTLTTTAPVL